MIAVVSKYKEPEHVWCGRPTPVGNPFPVNAERTRDQACDLYHEWFYEQIASDNKIVMDFLEKLEEIAIDGDLNLGCVCDPLRCHTETILHYLNQRIYGTEEYAREAKKK